MSNSWLFCTAVAILWSCSPYPSDPAALRSRANEYERGTQSASEATAQARYDRQVEATELGRSTDRAIALEVTALAITAEAGRLRATDYAAYATQQQSTLDAANYLQNYWLNQTARADEANMQRSQAKREETMKWSGVLLCSTSLLAIMFLGGSFIWRLIEVWRKTKLAYVDAVSRPPLALPPPSQAKPSSSVQAEIVDFLELAVQVNGEAAKQVPSDDRMNISSERWQRITGTLEYHQYIIVVPSRGSYVRDEYGNIGELLRQFKTRQKVILYWRLPQQ